MSFSAANLPHLSARLYHLAISAAQHKQHRVAALSFSAASRTPALSSSQQAFLLYRAAGQLFVNLHPPTSESDDDTFAEDKNRALGYLQKCTLLLTSESASVQPRMHVLALIDKIASFTLDHPTAAKAIQTALNTLSSTSAQNTELPDHFQWWLYFRSRSIANMLSHGNRVHDASSFAEKTADYCYSNGEHLSATAFYLSQTQIALGASAAGVHDISCAIDKMQTCSNALGDAGEGKASRDVLLMRFGSSLMHAFDLFRKDHVPLVYRKVLTDLSRYYNQLRNAQRNEERCQWTWLPFRYIAALVFHVLTVVTRMRAQSDKALVHAMTSLARIGISQEKLLSFSLDDICEPSVSPRATLSLAVMLLENAARLRLTTLDMEEASTLIAAAVDVSFRDPRQRAQISSVESGHSSGEDLSLMLRAGPKESGLIPRCSTFLLLAEYHTLRGRVSGARVATEFLHAIRKAGLLNERAQSDECVTDIWHTAVSHLSLLTGDRRAQVCNIGNGTAASAAASGDGEDVGPSSTFVTRQVEALAWFTVGVFYMRSTEVLESRNALFRCLNIVQEPTTSNEQLVANTMAVLSGLAMMHETITEDAHRMTYSAVNAARQLNDHVTLARATRQYRKLAHRLLYTPDQREDVDRYADSAWEEMSRRQQAAPLIFVQEI